MTAALSFGGWLKRRRMSLGLTQKELARRVGYAPVTLRKVEADELRPSGQMSRKLAEALELAPKDQEQFVRFARDEAHWDDLRLPSHTTAAPLPTAQLHPLEQPAIVSQQADTVLDRRKTRHNLPALTTTLVGRDEELAELAQLLADPGTRLVTILSAGGMGKTHLALAMAWQQVEQFAHGACWVALAPLTDPNELVLAIAAALGLQLQGERTPEQQVGDFLCARHLLLVLDNFEHLLEGAQLVGELLTTAPQLSILVTSRQRLKLSSETVIFLDGLRCPPEQSDNVSSYPAVQLFLLHARRQHRHHQPDEYELAGVVAVCRLVHGMPLGILLAAAWAGVISPAEIAAEIGRDLGFLQAALPDMPARQRSLRAVFLHTWERLSTAESDVFMRLSVFRGGATAEAARLVTGATLNVLGGLIDKALLRRLPNGRLDIHELLRQFAAEHLAGTNAVDERRYIEAQLQHSRYYLNLLSEQEQPLQGPQQRAALDIIHGDFENICVAWRWGLQQHEIAVLAPAVHPLFLYCNVRGTYREGMILFAAAALEQNAERTAGTDDQQASQALRERMIVRLGACEILLGNYERGERLLLDSLPRIKEHREHAFALLYLGQAASERGELALAHSRIAESLEFSRQCDDFASMAMALHILIIGQPVAEAHRLSTESLALARKAGRPDLLAITLNDLGWQTWCLGDYALANAYWQEGVTLCDQLGLRGENAWPLDCLGFAAWCQGDMAAAERYIESALAIYTEVGRQAHIGMCLADLALVLASTDRVRQAIALARQAVAITRAIDGQMMLLVSLDHLGAVLLVGGELEEARCTLLEAVQRAWDHQYQFTLMIAFYNYAELLVVESRSVEAPGAMERLSLALILLNCVRTHEATWQAYKDKAAQMQASVESALPAAVLSASVVVGESQAVDQLVNMLIGAGLKAPGTQLQPDPGEDVAAPEGDPNEVLF